MKLKFCRKFLKSSKAKAIINKIQQIWMVTGVYFATVVSYSCKLFISPAPDVAAAVIKLLINCHWAKVKCKLIQESE
jgi:hypothetical protein